MQPSSRSSADLLSDQPIEPADRCCSSPHATMLRLQPKEKERRKVAIPDELREAFVRANAIIAQSERDPHLSIEQDNAIQCGCLIGGLVGNARSPIELRYFPSANRSLSLRWDLALSRLEIEDIANGLTTDLLLYCCQEPDCGYKSTCPDGLCSCDYIDDPYCGEVDLNNATEALRRIGLPTITGQSLRDEVVAILGPPNECGGGENHPRLGHVWRWLKYERPDCCLRFDFKASGVMQRIFVFPKRLISEM